jgi:hypothetical protein
MASPPIQRALKWLGFTLGGLLCLGAFLDSISNSISLVTLRAAIYATSAIVPTWLLAELFAKLIGIPWGGQPGSRPRIRSLGPALRFGLVGVLSLLWLPQVGLLILQEDTIPTLQVEVHNPTDNIITVATRGEFVLWLPTALYDGIPRIGGKLQLLPIQSADPGLVEFTIGPRASVRCVATFLDPKRFVPRLNAADADASLVIPTSVGIRISPNFPFTRDTVGKRYVEWSLESSDMQPKVAPK